MLALATAVVYVPCDFLQGYEFQSLGEDETSCLRLYLDSQNRPQAHTVITVVHVNGNHYCLVAYDTIRHVMHVMGRRLEFRHNTKGACTGKDLLCWSRLSQIFGWEQQSAPEVREVSWSQNGYDCGIYAMQIAEYIFIRGEISLSNGFAELPQFVCSHTFRTRVLLACQQSAIESRAIFQDMWIRYPSWLLKMGVVDHMGALESVPQSLSEDSHSNIIQELEEEQASCIDCTRRSPSIAGPLVQKRNKTKEHFLKDIEQAIESVCDLEMRIGSAEEVKKSAKVALGYLVGLEKRRYLEVDERRRKIVGSEEGTVISEDCNNKDGNRNTGQDESDADTSDCVQQLKITEREQQLSSYQRFPVPKLPPLKVTLYRLKPNFHFDDYEGGPLLDDLIYPLNAWPQMANWDLVHTVYMTSRYPWARYRDCGWRLEPGWHMMFGAADPINPQNHLLEIPHNFPYSDTLSKTLPRVGAKEMNKIADIEGSRTIFYKGRGLEASRVALDLERDGVSCKKVHITIRIDIDSMMWFGLSPPVIDGVLVYTSPVVRDKAPIWKSNHCYVNLTYPQTEEDRANGGRSEYYQRRFSLSQLPHTWFGKTGQGSATANFFIVFPRMAHQDIHTHRWTSVIPFSILSAFWDTLLIPAIRYAVEDMDRPYVGLDRSHVKYKKGNTKFPPSHPLLAEQWDKMIDWMRTKVCTVSRIHLLPLMALSQIKSNVDSSLARFGSFFFVIEMKGIKGWTKQVMKSTESSEGFDTSIWDDSNIEHCLEDVYDALKRLVPRLDWSHMIDRSRGELLLDMAITFGGTADKGVTSLVGLPRLSKLEASSAQSRFLAGQCHPMAGLDQFGALQCETASHVAESSHVAFRLTYPLAYEVARKTDNTRSLFQPSDVYQRNNRFHDDVESITQLFSSKSIMETGYGVRLEFRLGGKAYFMIAKHLGRKVGSVPVSQTMQLS